MDPKKLFMRDGLKRAVVAVTISSLVGCTLGDYPTATQIANTKPDVPQLESITDGHTYLAVVRNKLVQGRHYLQYLDGTMDAGIVASLMAFSLGTALKWGHDVNIITGITSAAIIGGDSALSLKQQEAVINKGLDALNCIQAQAESAYVAVRPYDNALKQVRLDIANLESAISQVAGQAAPADLAAAQSLVAQAKVWLSVESVPAENVDAALKVAVDTALQTTVDQLDSNLPDGSAFAKISFSPPAAATTPPGSPAPKATFLSADLIASQPVNLSQPLGVGLPAPAPPPPSAQVQLQAQARVLLQSVSSTLSNDMTAAGQKISSLGPTPALTQLPTFNSACPTPPPSSPPQFAPPQVSFANPIIGLTKGSTLIAKISGGTPPYMASISANPPATPGDISYLTSPFRSSSLTLTSSAALSAGGTYTLTITDANAAPATATFTTGTTASPGPNPGIGRGTPAQQLAIVLNPNSTTLPSGTAGSITVTVTKGTAPYTPSIPSPFTVGSSTTGTFSLNYPALALNSTYTLTVKDKNGLAASVKLTVGSPLSVVMPPPVAAPAVVPKSP